MFHHPWTVHQVLIILWREGKLTADEILLMGFISWLTRLKYGCIASNSTLAEYWGNGKSKSTVERAIRKFRELGLIRVKIKQNNTRKIEITFRGDEIAEKFLPKGGTSRMTWGHVTDDVGGTSRMTTDKEDKEDKGKEAIVTLARRGSFFPLPANNQTPIEGPIKFSHAVKTFHEFGKGQKYHIATKDKDRTIYVKGAHGGGWKRETLAKWESAYRGLRARLEKARIKEVLHWYIENHDHAYLPVCKTFLTFAERFDQIEKAMRRETNQLRTKEKSSNKAPNGSGSYRIEPDGTRRKISTIYSNGYADDVTEEMLDKYEEIMKRKNK